MTITKFEDQLSTHFFPHRVSEICKPSLKRGSIAFWKPFTKSRLHGISNLLTSCTHSRLLQTVGLLRAERRAHISPCTEPSLPDVINEYAFARSDHLSMLYYHPPSFGMHVLNKYDAVERPDFGAEVTDNLLMGTHLGPLVKHANWALNLINALPESFSGRWIPGQPPTVPVFF